MSTSAPYVGLDYFREEDARLFFGRDAERKRIIGNLRASRLTLLYAESGVGKSSLLRAGVSARLRQFAARSVAQGGSARYVPVVVSAWQGDSKGHLITALEAAARPLLPRQGQLTLRRDTLEGAIEDVAAAVDATALVILDQFEERILYEADDEFDDEIARCVNRRDLPANFLISVREDTYSLIGSRFKSRIANVYGNYLHLDFLDAPAARAAVLEPLNAFNRGLAAEAPHFEVEPALIEAVLQQVRRGRVTLRNGDASDVGADGSGRVETAYLQLVMKRLWDEEIAVGSQRLRLETLRRLGGADTIVHGHLDAVMATLPDDQRDAAAEAFRFLVTSGGRKIALSSSELAEFSQVGSTPLEPALKHLERGRILREISSSEPDGVARHEIYHDVLAPAVLDWRRRHVEERTERGLTQARERARRLEVRNRRLAAAVIALTVVGVALALYVWNPPPVQRLELGTVDARFSVRGARAADPRLRLIAVDDKTLARAGRRRQRDMSTANYARLLDRLRQDRPRLIAFDTVFEDQAKNTSGFPALRAAMLAMGRRLVLACKHYYVTAKETRRGHEEQVEYPELLLEPKELKDARVWDGYRGLPMDLDDQNRRVDYRVELFRPASALPEPPARQVKNVDTFAFTVADIARSGALKKNFHNLPTASRRVQGEQSKRTTWIDYVGPSGTVPTTSAIDVLDGRVPPAEFAHQVVVIGVTARGNPDVYRTPLDGGRSLSDAEVQANAIDTMLRGSPLRDVSRLLDMLAILVLACVPALASLSASRAVRVAAILGSAAVFLAVAQLAFDQGRILAVMLPLAALAASAAGTVASRMVRRRGVRRRVGSANRLSSS